MLDLKVLENMVRLRGLRLVLSDDRAGVEDRTGNVLASALIKDEGGHRMVARHSFKEILERPVVTTRRWP